MQLAAKSYILWWRSSHRGLLLAERSTKIHADDAGRGLVVAKRRPRAGRRCICEGWDLREAALVERTRRGWS